MGEIITQRQDVPEWARPVSYAGLENIFKLLFNPPNPKDPNNYWKNGQLDASGGRKSDMAAFTALRLSATESAEPTVRAAKR